MVVTPPAPSTFSTEELTVDALAAHTGLPVRTIREYQTMGVLPPPERRGRVGIYGATHVARLELIGRLQRRGYSLAGIKDLLGSWRDGADLASVLGLEPDQLVHLDEPGAPATLDQLGALLPTLLPDRLAEVLAVGLVEVDGPDRYCVPSPSMLQLAVDALATGYPPDAILGLLRTVHDATEAIADAAVRLISDPPSGATSDRIAALAARGRGLLAHGTGRLTVYAIGQRLDPDATTATPSTARSTRRNRR